MSKSILEKKVIYKKQKLSLSEVLKVISKGESISGVTREDRGYVIEWLRKHRNDQNLTYILDRDNFVLMND